MPKDGVLIHGLFMDAFRWDNEAKKCVESKLGEMNPPLPMLHMEPKRNYVPVPTDYISPLYRTAARAGTLSTTGKDLILLYLNIYILNITILLSYRSFNQLCCNN